MSHPNHALRAVIASAAAVLLLATIGPSAHPIAAQVVRGQVVDSATGNPLARATVHLLDSRDVVVDTRMADDVGLFLFPLQGVGSFRLRAEHPGYTASSFPLFEVAAESEQSFLLLLPSPEVTAWYRKLLSDACQQVRDRGTIIGWVRQGDTRVPVPGATIKVAWATVPNFVSEAVSVAEFSGEARADSAGVFTICGAPLGTRVWLHAEADSAFSNFLNLTFANDSVIVGQDVYASTNLVWRQDLTVLRASERNTTVTGIVTSDVSGTPVPGAAVSIMGTDFSTETDSTGWFELTRLPSGPVRLIVRRIGNEILQREYFLPGAGTFGITTGELMLGDVTVLDPLVVETTPGHNPLAEFNQRRARGVGTFLTREEFSRQGSPATAVDVLRRVPGVRVMNGGDFDQRWIISMQRGGPRTFGNASNEGSGISGSVDFNISDVNPCPPLVFLDRHYIGTVNQIDVDAAIPLETVAAVETHQSAASLPNQWSRPGSSCGVIAFWTRFAETRSMEVSDDERAHRSLLDTTGFHMFLALAAVVGIFIGLGKAVHF